MFTWFCLLISLNFAAPPAVCENANDEKRCAKPASGESTITITNFDDNKYCNCDFANKNIVLALDKSVTSIPQYAFYKTKVSSISSSDVTTVDEYAFQNCDINTITLQAVLTIKSNTFYLSKIGSITLATTKTVDTDAFYFSSITGTISLPDATTINNNAFKFSKIYSISLPKVTTIAENAFQYSEISNSISLPVVKTINNNAFQGSKISCNVLFSKVTTIGNYAFQSSKISGSISFTILTTIPNYAFQSSEIYSISLPEVTTIAEYAFHLSKITNSYSSLSLPKVTKIGNRAFEKCTFSNSISFGYENKLTTIGSYSFNCAIFDENYNTIQLPKSVTTINEYAFTCQNNDNDDFVRENPITVSLYNVKNLNKIGKYAFSEQKISLDSNKIPLSKAVVEIEEGIFNDAKSTYNSPLTIDINFQDYTSLTTIGEKAFNNVNLKGKISINDKIKTIRPYALYTSSKGTITVYLNSTKSLLEFGYKAFNDPVFYLDEKFNNVLTFTKDMKIIGSLAYFQSSQEEKYEIKKVVFDNECKFDSIGDEAFKDCNEWTFEGKITAHSIGTSAFENCFLLNLPIRITTDSNGNGGTIGQKAFLNCKNLVNTLTIDPVTTRADVDYPTIKDYAFQNSGIRIIDLAPMKSIGVSAFEGCEKLEGSSSKDLIVDTIDQKAFYLDYLVNFPNIKSHEIKKNAFTGCIKLAPTKIQIVPDKHRGGNIYKYAFMNCLALESTLQIDEPLEPEDKYVEKVYSTIYDSAFKDSGIKTLDFKCIIEEIKESAFENCLKLSSNKALVAKTIGTKAFKGDINLVFQTITAEVINSNAFCQCYNLGANIEINDKSRGTTQELIGANAFEDCYLLGTLHFNTTYINEQNEPELRSIGQKAFLNSGLKGPLTIPNTINSISSQAFSFCKNIGNVVFESKYLNELEINSQAFYHSDVTGNLIIPNTVTTVGKNAFAYTGITTLTIQGSVIPDQNNDPITIKSTQINDKAFYYCTKLTTLTFGDGKIKLYETSSCDSFRGCNLGTVNLGSLEKIPKETFYGMTNLNFPNEIPNTLKTIDERAFAQCSGITNFKLSEKSQLETVADGAFYKCSRLKSFTFPFAVPKVKKYAFYQCTSLESVKFNNNIDDIEDYAFYGCSNLKGPLVLSNQLGSIGKCAFQNCYSLDQSLTIPNSVAKINERAFMGCSSFTGDLTFGRSITQIGKYSFRDCSGFDGHLIFPDFFENKAALTLDEGAFYGCSGFTGDLTIPQASDDANNDLTPNLNNYVFRGCSGFDGVLNLPNTVTEIPEGAFYGCTNLGGDISLMKLSSVGKYAFYGCSHLSGSINLEDMKNGGDDGGNTPGGGSDTPGGGGYSPETHGEDSSSSDSITINEFAFYGCQGLNGSLILPTDCEIEVKEHAFDGCSNLKGTLDGSLFTKIKKYGFAHCSSLSGQLDFGDKTTEIQEYAFLDCSGFSDQLSFIIDSVEDNGLAIGHCAFKGCKGFKNGRLTFNINANEEQKDIGTERLSAYYRYNYFLKIGNDAFDGTKFKNVYYMGRFEPDCDYDIGISSIKGIHTSSNYANKTFCGNPIHKSKLSGGAIAGIVIACIVVVAVIVFLIIFFILKNKRNKDQSEAEVEMNQDP